MHPTASKYVLWFVFSERFFRVLMVFRFSKKKLMLDRNKIKQERTTARIRIASIHHFMHGVLITKLQCYLTNYKRIKETDICPMLHGNSVEDPFHVSETFRNRNLSKTCGNVLETRFLKISVWKISLYMWRYFHILNMTLVKSCEI